MSEDLKWYVGTRRDSKAHVMVNSNYMEAYESEFERIREFDTPEEAMEAYKVRELVDREERSGYSGSKIAAAKVRGDIKKGSMEDEDLRTKLKAELRAELMAEEETGAATMGKKTTARSKKTGPGRVRSAAPSKEKQE